MLGSQSFFFGDFPTYADFAIYTVMDLVRLVEPKEISQHDNITAWMARVEQLPGVKEYLESRPEAATLDVNAVINA